MSRLALALSLSFASLTGCFTTGGALIGSQFETTEHTRLKDGSTIDVHGNHALAGLLVGAVFDAAVIGVLIAAENAASSWKIGPICTDSGMCY